ncbi:hypothetical protein [Phyllobacterium sp. K27]
MTTPTVPQDIYLRHEREWQMLRQAIAEKTPAVEEQPMENLAPRRKVPLKEQHQ